jgi:hypothetical protein
MDKMMKTRNFVNFPPIQMQRRLFIIALSLVLTLMVVFGVTGGPMNTIASPYGIVSFELAGTPERADEILSSWGQVGRERAAFSLGLDFLFIPVYIVAIIFGCALASRSIQAREWPLAHVGHFLSIGVIFAGVLDVVENISLLVVLFATITVPWPQVASWCAVPKFALIFLALVYTLYGGVISLVIKPDRGIE